MEKNQHPKLTLKLNKQVIAVLAQADLMAIKGGQNKINLFSVEAASDCTGRPTSFNLPGSFICCEEQQSN